MTEGTRVLLVDNYDSYTYNLAALVCEVIGSEPVVIPVDKVSEADIRAAACVVVSPGPGHPLTEPALVDCLRLLLSHEVPTLGVCLGHQAIVTAFGGEVARAQPAHGDLAEVRHTGKGLFEGLPSPFRAVRYHSLAATDVPDGLVVDAVTPDGLVMAVRHATLPFYGVQFHPESILSECRTDIMAQFLRLVGASGVVATQDGSQLPSSECGSMSSEVTGSALPGADAVTVTLPWCDPGDVVPHFLGDAPRAFWLDSALRTPWSGRFSVAGVLDEHDLSLVFDASAGVCSIRGPEERLVHRHILDVIGSAQQDSISAATRGEPCKDGGPELPFTSGWVGMLGYACGEIPARPSPGPEPDAFWMRAESVVVFDHETRRVYLHGPEDRVRRDRTRLDEAYKLAARDEGGTSLDPGLGAADIDIDSPGRARYPVSFSELEDELRAGNTYEALLSFRMSMASDADPREVYRRLRAANSAPYAALLRHDDVWLLASSPERFLSADIDGRLSSRPIKGTLPRGATEQADALARWNLATDDKFRRENLMIVDLVRNDLNRVCVPGTVEVTRLMDVESYATVHQLVTTVEGQVRPATSPVDAVRALFPPGSMTGAPKKRTMEIIDRIESQARGAYGGVFGWLADDGTADLAVVIRTITARPPEWAMNVGGGIIIGSQASDELEEAILKGERVTSALAGTA